MPPYVEVRRARFALMPCPALVECFDPGPNHCVIAPICKLRSVLGEALEALYATLDGYTLEDITQNKRRLEHTLEAARATRR